MMRVSVLFPLLFLDIVVHAQNVGIGTNTPSGKLEIVKPTGTTPTLVLHGSTYTSIFHTGSNEDITLQGGKADAYLLLQPNGGNVGIGTGVPATRLDIASLGNWDLVNTEGDMRLGNSNYRLKFGVALGGGGIGAAGIMQQGGINLLNIGSNGNYQLQLNGADNSVNINNAIFKLNGNAGQPGQVLTSSGNGAPSWQPLSNVLKTYYVYSYTYFVNVNSNAEFPLTNSTITLNVDRPTRFVVCANFRMDNSCPLIGGCDGRAWFLMKADGVLVAPAVCYVKSSGWGAAGGAITNFFQDFGPGTHTIQFAVKKDAGQGSVDFSASLLYATVLGVPVQ